MYCDKKFRKKSVIWWKILIFNEKWFMFLIIREIVIEGEYRRVYRLFDEDWMVRWSS